MTVFQIRALKRSEEKEKGSKLRAHGEIPAIYYRKNTDSIPLKLKQKDVNALLKAPKGLVRIQLENNQTMLAVAKEVQTDPVGKAPLHIQFEGIKEGEAFHIAVPVKIEHTPGRDWEKNQGQCIQKLSHLNIEVLPVNMPDAIHINVDKMKIGDKLSVEDLNYKNIKFLDNPHTEVLSINYTKVMDVPETAPAATEVADSGLEADAANKNEKSSGTDNPAHGASAPSANAHTHANTHAKSGKH